MKKIKLVACIISLIGYFNINAQTEIMIPVTQASPIIWLNPDGTSGECGGGNVSVCSTTICLGESICFSYWVNQTQAGNLDLTSYNLNHTSLSFSDGGSIVVENIDYTGPNASGCVNYAPTTTGIITTYGVNNSTFKIYVLPSTPPILSVNITPPNPICEGSQICAQSLTSPIVNYSFSSTTALGCFNGLFCNTPNTSAFCFPAGNHQILYTVNAGHTCSNTAVYNVGVLPATLSLTIVSPTVCSNNYCFNVNSTSGCSLSNINYSWNISDNIGNTVYYQTNSLKSVCLNLLPGNYDISVYATDLLFAYSTFTVPPIDACACQNCSNPIGISGSISTSPATDQKYCINNNVRINGNITFANSEFKVAPNVAITIAPNATLTINRAHLFSATNMWNGIIVQNGGKLNIVNNSLIEDAITGVSIINHTTQTNILTVDESVFNKNLNAIKIQDYNQSITTYPFTITNSIFTCRKIADCSTIAGWPLTATIKAATNPISTPLNSPYINDISYPVVNLKTPYANLKSLRGVHLINVGKSSVTTTSSIYNEIVIGTLTGTDTYNVFDNLWFGINAQNSNISVVNCIFQNGFNFPNNYSTGITTTSPNNLNNRLQISTTSYINNNKFYNVARAIKTTNYHELAVNYCEMYSTRIYNPKVNSQFGAFGVSASSNHYNVVNMNNNKIYNIDNALVFNATIGTYSVGSTISTSGQYLGSIYANNNSIRSQVVGYIPSPSLNYGLKGISIIGLISSNTVLQPNATIQINNNNIFDYENGIACSNWNPMGIITKANTIIIRNKTANVYQYGIEHVNNTLYPSFSFKQYGIVENNVTANAISTNTNNYAIRSVQNGNYAIVCNTVSNTYNGHAFSGTHINNAFVRFNIMSTNHYGFVLENVGIIGVQGSNNGADFGENQWLGNTWSSNFKTATLNSNAQLSKMYVRNSTTFNPSGSGYTDGQYLQNEYSIASSNIQTTATQSTFYNCFLTKPAPTGSNTDALEFIASSGATSGIDHAIARFVAKSQLFVYLQNNPSAKTPGILTGFYNSNKHKYRETFYDVETNVAQNDINTAKNAVAAFNPVNSTEDKHKQFFDLLFKYQNQTINTTDEKSLLALAKGCPYIDGTAVHQARALYNLVTDQNLSFTDSCDYKQSNARLGKIADEVYEEETTMQGNDVYLYPNPSNGSDIFISIAKSELESVDVTVNNINGLAFSKETIALTNGIGKLNIKASNGVYMVIITNNKTNERVIKKLVIQK